MCDQRKPARSSAGSVHGACRAAAPEGWTNRCATGDARRCQPLFDPSFARSYPEPERFRPERWRDINPTQYEYLPFNAGPRICIGAAFATQVLKISLAMILQRFRFTVVPGTRINRIVAISMNPRHGLPMIIAKKDRNYSVNEVCGQIREMVNFPPNGSG